MTHYSSNFAAAPNERWIERNHNKSTIGKVQKQFWFTKSAVIRKFGKKEDEHFVASDAELDAKIELFHAIEMTTKELQILLADYQNRICTLAQEENSFGHILKEFGKEDKSRAGKMMTAVGKSLNYTAQQRVALRNPLVRLFQEVDTFHSRAVEDTAYTVSEMEKFRTEYRGALMWLKNISRDFNPERYDQLEKFREVQAIVKQKKTKFDSLKVKTLQKIDLLAASRCNMFSHALIVYQNNLITFSEKTAKTLNSIACNFEGYHPYKFQVIKELVDPIPITEKDEEKHEDELLGKDDRSFFNAEYHDDKYEGKLWKPKDEKNKNEKSNNPTLDNLINLANNTESQDTMKTSISHVSDIDLLTGNNSIMESSDEPAYESVHDILKELLESPTHEVSEQTLPIFGSDSGDGFQSSSKGSIKIPQDSNTGSQNLNRIEKMFMPSQLLDYGLDDSTLKTPALNNQILLPSSCQVNKKAAYLNSSNASSKLISSDLSNSKTVESKKQESKLDWYKIFQDIDPLTDPGSGIFGKDSNKQC